MCGDSLKLSPLPIISDCNLKSFSVNPRGAVEKNTHSLCTTAENKKRRKQKIANTFFKKKSFFIDNATNYVIYEFHDCYMNFECAQSMIKFMEVYMVYKIKLLIKHAID